MCPHVRVSVCLFSPCVGMKRHVAVRIQLCVCVCALVQYQGWSKHAVEQINEHHVKKKQCTRSLLLIAFDCNRQGTL